MSSFMRGLVAGLFIVSMLALPASVFATKYRSMPMEELTEVSKYVVLGEVLTVEDSESDDMNITVQVGGALKGEVPDDSKTFVVVLPKKVRDAFKVELNRGDRGVFFLESLADGKGKLAYTASIALFEQRGLFSLD